MSTDKQKKFDSNSNSHDRIRQYEENIRQLQSKHDVVKKLFSPEASSSYPESSTVPSSSKNFKGPPPLNDDMLLQRDNYLNDNVGISKKRNKKQKNKNLMKNVASEFFTADRATRDITQERSKKNTEADLDTLINKRKQVLSNYQQTTSRIAKMSINIKQKKEEMNQLGVVDKNESSISIEDQTIIDGLRDSKNTVERELRQATLNLAAIDQKLQSEREAIQSKQDELQKKQQEFDEYQTERYDKLWTLHSNLITTSYEFEKYDEAVKIEEKKFESLKAGKKARKSKEIIRSEGEITLYKEMIRFLDGNLENISNKIKSLEDDLSAIKNDREEIELLARPDCPKDGYSVDGKLTKLREWVPEPKRKEVEELNQAIRKQFEQNKANWSMP